MKQEGLLSFSTYDVSEFDGQVTINWLIKLSFTWNYKFKANKITKVKHQYVPYSGAAPFSGESTIYDDKDFCIDKQTRNAIKKTIKQKNNLNTFTPVFWIDYILKSATSWKAPIKVFELYIKKSNTKDIVSTCFSGKFIKKDPLTLYSKIENFVPQEDLSVLFFPASRSGAHNGKKGSVAKFFFE